MLTEVPVYQPTLLPSSQTSRPAVPLVLRPAAEIVTGAVTVDPFEGEQMLTPGEDGCAHCAAVTVGKLSTITNRRAEARTVAILEVARNM